MAYAGIPADTDRGAAVFVDKILKGAKPRRPPGRTADALPAGHQLEDGEALGLTIPPLLLARADEVID